MVQQRKLRDGIITEQLTQALEAWYWIPKGLNGNVRMWHYITLTNSLNIC